MLFLDLLQNSHCFALGNKSLAQDMGLQAISLKENIQIATVLLFHKEYAMSSFALRNFINILLSVNKQPPLKITSS